MTRQFTTVSFIFLSYLFSLSSSAQDAAPDAKREEELNNQITHAIADKDFKLASNLINKLKPLNNSSFLHAKSVLYEEKGDISKAVKYMSQKVDKYPIIGNYIDRGLMYERMGMYGKAESDFEIASRANNFIAFRFRIRYLIRRHNYAFAHCVVDENRSHYTPREIFAAHSEICEQAGELRKAYDWLAKGFNRFDLEQFNLRHPEIIQSINKEQDRIIAEHKKTELVQKAKEQELDSLRQSALMEFLKRRQ